MFKVPSTFASQSRRGFVTDLTTLDCAARWTMAAGRIALSTRWTESLSVISSTSSAAAGGTRSGSPVERSSTTTTRVSPARSASATWDPIKPAPPVTTTVGWGLDEIAGGLGEDGATVNAMILAAGRGTRLGSLGQSIPKVLVPIRGRPLLEWHL